MEQGLLVSCLEAKDLIEALEITARIGYRHCEIGVLPDDWRPNLATIDEDARKRAVDRVRELGMSISSVQCHMHNGYADANPKTRRDCVDHTRRMIDLCARFDIPICHVVSGVAEDDASHDEKLDRVAESLLPILEHAAGSPVKVGIEPVFVYVVCTVAHMNALLARLDNRDDLYVNFDPSHFPFHDQPPEDFIRAFGSRIIHAHSKDALVRPAEPGEDAGYNAMPRDRVFAFTAPGTGMLDWTSILSTLQDVGFDGVLSLEMGHGYQGPPNDIARSTYEFFRDKHGLL